MNIQDHIKFSIEAFERQEKEHALMHACISIDATARKHNQLPRTTRKSYINCLRNYYWLLGAFIGGLDLNTKFEHVAFKTDDGQNINNPDIADIVYYIFRCNSAHASKIPSNYGLVEVKDGKTAWGFGENGVLYIPERIIWGLLAISVFSKANVSLASEGDYFLSYESERFKRQTIFTIRDYWGKEEEIKQFLVDNPPKLILLDDLKKYKKYDSTG